MMILELAALMVSLVANGTETVNFDGVKPGSAPPGWSVSSTKTGRPPEWRVIVDKTAPSRPHVLGLAPMGGQKKDTTFALLEKGACTDGDVSVDVKFVSGHYAKSGGLVWRYKDQGNYYFALASADREQVSIYKKVNDQVTLIAPATMRHTFEERNWNVMRVVFKGQKFTLYFGHRKVIEAKDNTFAMSGKTGVWTQGDTVAYFDNFRVDKKN